MKIFNKVLGVVILLFAVSSVGFTQEVKNDAKSLVVISDKFEQANKQYYIYPEVSEMVASEVINELNKEGIIKAPMLSTTREKLRSASLERASAKLLDGYRYTYAVDYEALKKIAKAFNSSNVLLVTGGLDTTSDFLKPTWWNFLNVPGENVVKSEYRLYTYIALIDTNTETISWQNTYHRQITAPEFALANATNSPDYRQLTKIKKGSNVIAKDVAYRVESVLTPWFAAQKQPPTMHELVKYKVNKTYDECVQNISDWKEKRTEEKAQKQLEQVNQGAVLKQTNNTTQVDEVNAVLKSEPQKTETKTDKNVTINNKKLKKDKSSNKLLEEENTASDLRGMPEEFDNVNISPLNIIIPKM